MTFSFWLHLVKIIKRDCTEEKKKKVLPRELKHIYIPVPQDSFQEQPMHPKLQQRHPGQMKQDHQEPTKMQHN